MTTTATATTQYGLHDSTTGITVWAPVATAELVWCQTILDLSLVHAGDTAECRWFYQAALEAADGARDSFRRFTVITR